MINQPIKKMNSRRKKILKPLYVYSKAQERSLRILFEDLRQEFAPQNAFQEFLIDKLMADLVRLQRLYEYEKDILKEFDFASGEPETNFIDKLKYGQTDSFLRYKTSVQRDIKDGHEALKKFKRGHPKT